MAQTVREVIAQLGQRPAQLGVGLERPVERVCERARQIATVALQRRQALADAPRRGGGGGAAHGVDAAERLIEHERQRVEVGGGTHLLAVDLLGGHVGERAEHVAGAGEGLLAGEQRAAEVGQLGDGSRILERRALRGLVEIDLRWHQHVLGLDVTVDHPAPVGVQKRVGERDPDFDHLLVAERVVGDQLGEGVTVNQLGDQVEGVVLDAGLVQSDDRGVREAGGGERLARGALAVFAGRERNHLDGDLTVEQFVVGAPHHPEAAGAKALEQPVAAEHRSAPARQRPFAAGTDRGAAERRGGGRDQGVVRVHRLLRSPMRERSLPQAGRRSAGEREVADGTNRESGAAEGPVILVPSSMRKQGAKQLVVLRR